MNSDLKFIGLVVVGVLLAGYINSHFLAVSTSTAS